MSYEKGRGIGADSFNINRKGTSIETHMTQMGYSSQRYGTGSHLGKRRIRSEEEYFDDDLEEASGGQNAPVGDLEYQPAPDSPSYKAGSDDDSDSSEDPLDSFMAGIEKEVEAQDLKQSKKKKDKDDNKGIRDDIEGEDDQESFFRYLEENPDAGYLNDEEEDIEYDADGNAIIPEHRKMIDPLPPCDHSQIQYEEFTKNFYEEHEEIRNLNPMQVNALRHTLGITVSGIFPPKPVTSFPHFGFDEALMKAIRKAGYTQPTPIQSQAVPLGLSGRDVIGIAKTGSGKTVAYLWPLLIHIMDQKELKPGDGPIGLICAPTRELSQQIYHEAKRFGKVYNIRVVCAYGGGSLWEQCKACEQGCEILVATPGRLIDLVKKGATNLKRVTYLVFDEADRMFNMGFEPQVRSIANHVRPDRQTMLFSATFRKKIERLCRDILVDPFRVLQGELGEANEDVEQIVLCMPVGSQKWNWLTSNLVKFTTIGSVLIFVTRKANSEELASNLKLRDFKISLMHGDMSQSERNEVITSFKRKDVPILIATDVAARGLDIPHIKTVVNYDPARDIDTHTHRIGRTGRAGEKGTAYTLILPNEIDFSGHLVRNLEASNQYVPPELLDIANKSNWFKKSRFKQNKAKKLDISKGLGMRERPGLGSGMPSGSGAGSSGPTSFTHYEPSRNAGPQSDRVTAMRSAFSNQYRMNFVTSSEDAIRQKQKEAADAAALAEAQEYAIRAHAKREAEKAERRKKKSRWDK